MKITDTITQSSIAFDVISTNILSITECYLQDIKIAYYFPVILKETRHSDESLHAACIKIARAICNGLDVRLVALKIYEECGLTPFSDPKATDKFFDQILESDI